MLRFTENLIVQMTLACNKNCKYCYEHYKGSNLQDKTPMDFETFRKYFDYYLYSRCFLGKKENSLLWHFHGGEVFLLPWKELRKMVAYVEERSSFFPNVDYCFQTNGTLVTEEIAFFLKSRNKSLGFSFDSFSDDDRGTKEENEALFDHIKDLKEKTGVTCSYLSVISKKNMKTWIQDWEKASSVCDALGLNSLCDTSDENILSPGETWEYWYKPVLESFLTETPIPERNVKVMADNLIMDLFFHGISLSQTGCFSRRCGHGSNMIALTSKGTLSPCDKFMESGDFEGEKYKTTIYEPDFLGLKNVKYVYHFCKDLFKAENACGCDTCSARSFCIGECQSYNLSRYGQIKLSPENCEPYKKMYDFIKSNLREFVLSVKCFPIVNEETLKHLGDLTSFGSQFLKNNPDISMTINNQNICFERRK